jgi:hypothetical protein
MSSDRLAKVLSLIDECNQKDPNQELDKGISYPKEWLYGQRMSRCLLHFEPRASEPLQIAARAQHIERWKIPRSDYPMDRIGYLKWRTFLYQFHANRVSLMMQSEGYEKSAIEQTESLLLKKNLKSNSEMQTLEDVICLVFLENYFLNFSKEHDEEKIISILKKTWSKMSEKGQIEALRLSMSKKATELIQKALRS